MPIFTFGVDFPDDEPPLESVRERQRNAEFLGGVGALDSLEESLAFTSERRVEIFAVSADRDATELSFRKTLSDRLRLSPKKLERYQFRDDGPFAVRRFYERIIGLQGSGINNLEAQAFRQSFLLAQKMNRTGPLLNRLFQRGLWLAEKVRMELNIGIGTLTAEHVVVDLAGKIFGGLHDHTALVVAQSYRCEKMMRLLAEKGLGRLLFASQKETRTRSLCELYHAQMVARDQLHSVLTSVDLFLEFDDDFASLSHSDISQILNKRKNAPLLWVTLFDPNDSGRPVYQFSSSHNVYYYSRADLREIVAKNLKEHQQTEAQFDRLINNEISDFIAWANSNEQHRFGNIVGKSLAMQKILELIARIAQTNASVLIDGESGTGKELVARAIHDQSARAENPFVVVNCGAIPENLLESELFGHVRGAFTGATSSKQGLFQAADQGTIFLDEIGETSQQTQVKLLRFLQEGEIKPVGSTETLKCEVRVIAATNRNLAAMVEDGSFRQDLYYRLNVIQITVPPLRERKEDITPLTDFFIKKYSQKIKKTVYDLSGEARQLLTQHDWRGNVRELENAVERAVALASSEVLTSEDLPPAVVNGEFSKERNHGDGNLTLKELERRQIALTLQEHNWNYDLVTKILGIGRTTLWRKMKEYEISNSAQSPRPDQ